MAVAIVAQAVWGIARTLCPDRERATIAVVAALIVLFSSSSIGQITAISLGGVVGLWLCRKSLQVAAEHTHISMPISRPVGIAALTAFAVLLGGLPLLKGLTGSQGIALFEAFYHSGALVFGGSHVVLPLLRDAVVTPSWISDDWSATLILSFLS
jgi:chromate transporter